MNLDHRIYLNFRERQFVNHNLIYIWKKDEFY